MKKTFSLIGFGFLMLTSNAAYETTPDGLTWKYEIRDNKAVIVSREESIAQGSYPNITYRTVYNASISTNTSGAVTIPESLGGCPVVSLEHDALRNCSKITSLTLPNCVTNIGSWTWSGQEPKKGGAFAGCSGIRDVYIGNLAQLYNSITFQNREDNPFSNGIYSFTRSVDLHVDGAVVTEVVIPEGVTEINDYAFSGWSNLSKITVAHSVTNIGKSAFYYCTGLREIELPRNLISIGESAFSGCANVVRISIPPSVTTIGDGAFSGCGRNSGLSLELPRFDYGGYMSRIVSVSSVTNLIFTADLNTLPYEVSTFTNLVGITIPQSVTNITSTMFNNCARLKTEWTKALANLSLSGVGAGAGYNLSNHVADRSIMSIVVDRDTAIDEFMLVNGKVYDMAIRIVNEAATAVHITLPAGYTYESFLGAAPLTLPANSTSILTITRTGDKTFLVARRQLQTIK